MSKRTIWIVDDESYVRNYLEDFFRLEGYKAVSFRNAEEAFDRSRELGDMRDHIIFTDFDMHKAGGKMNGVQFTDALHENGKRPKIVLMSGAPPINLKNDRIHLLLQKPLDLGYVEITLKAFEKC